ncbi:hypothetical protein HK096_001270 [Nowakowskiella sp. JEL0078]|nr:hypothetical protein HK096_001270 [Nowakowskiella sp. JEL0078]
MNVSTSYEDINPQSYLSEELDGGKVLRYFPFRDNQPPITFAVALNSIKSGNTEFMAGFLQTLKDCPFPGYFFETPAMTGDLAMTRPFEFVLIDCPELAAITGQPDKVSFLEKLDVSEKNGELVANFANLSGDTILVSPSQQSTELTVYTHIASFSRGAPVNQQYAVWERAASILQDSYSNDTSKPFWLSTSGLSVHWLHIRIDTRPKYYSWEPYKKTFQVD